MSSPFFLFESYIISASLEEPPESAEVITTFVSNSFGNLGSSDES
jgi:hypothetical protein